MALKLILARYCAVSNVSCKVYLHAALKDYTVRYCENGVHKPKFDLLTKNMVEAFALAGRLVPFLPLQGPSNDSQA
jgi:hypothetical protein